MRDLNKLEENLDNSLEKETKESLTEFINKQRDSREEEYYFVKYQDKWDIAYYCTNATKDHWEIFSLNCWYEDDFFSRNWK